MVRPVRAAGGKNPFFLLTAEARRANQWRPTFAEHAVKNKMYPNIIKRFQAAHAIGLKTLIQRNADFRGRYQAGLAGNAEFLFVGRANGADGFYGVLHVDKFVEKFVEL